MGLCDLAVLHRVIVEILAARHLQDRTRVLRPLTYRTGQSYAGVTHRRGPAAVVIVGLALIQNLRRGRYELGTEAARRLRVTAAFSQLAEAI